MCHIARKCKLRIEVILQVTSKLPRQKQMSRYLSATSNLLKQKQMSRYLLATSKTAQAKTNVTLFVGDIKDVQRVKEPLFLISITKGRLILKKLAASGPHLVTSCPFESRLFDIKNRVRLILKTLAANGPRLKKQGPSWLLGKGQTDTRIGKKCD
jgi:hypothetical protein